MNELDLQILKEALEVLRDYEGEDIKSAREALNQVIKERG